MSTIAQLSPNSVLSNPRDINPQNKIEKVYSVPVVEEKVQTVGKRLVTDTVTISQQAIKMLASDLEFIRVPPWITRTTKERKK